MTRCADPIAFETLVALWAGELDDDEASRVEEHLFGCDACSETSERLARLVGGLREAIPPVLAHAHRDRLLERGLQILHTPVAAGVTAHAHFAPGLDLMVHVLRGDLAGAERVDVDFVTADGVTRLTLEAVPFDADAGEVLIACQRHFQGMFPDGSDPTFRVHAVEGERRRHVGDYYVEHAWA